MAAISWIICVCAFLAALACHQDMPSLMGWHLSLGLMIASLLCCPILWRGPVMSNVLTGKQRFMGCVALILALPLVLPPVI
ncbi:MAG: hypothetical protein E2598_09775 [Sphingobium sp.]|nr:hypothetical protein [Sphingobium sp.]